MEEEIREGEGEGKGERARRSDSVFERKDLYEGVKL